MVDLLVGQYAPKKRPLPTTIIPNWEKASFFPPPVGAATPAPWNEAGPLGLNEKFVVLYLGNTGVGHPFETVVEAAKRLKDRGVVFLFVGGGKRWKWLEDAKAREGLDNLLLHGYVQKELTGSVMMAADCALITLGEEMAGVMSPSKLHSNLAMRLPVVYVGPKTSNVDEAIERFACGVSVRQGDVDGVVRFIETAMADRAQLAALQAKARGAFEAAYCDTQTLPQFERILDGLVTDKQSNGASHAESPAVAVGKA
jgi:glycosyltransferase involved in cell wall biosynthesis